MWKNYFYLNVFNMKLLLVNEDIAEFYISAYGRRDRAHFSSGCWNHAKIKPFARRCTAKVATEYWPQAPRGALPIWAKLLTLSPHNDCSWTAIYRTKLLLS